MPLSRRALGSRRADNWRRLPPVGLELSSEQRKQRWGLIMRAVVKNRLSFIPRYENHGTTGLRRNRPFAGPLSSCRSRPKAAVRFHR